MIQPAKIATVMGGEKIFHGQVKSFFDLERAVEEGLPKAALKNVAGFVFAPKDQFNFIYRLTISVQYNRFN